MGQLHERPGTPVRLVKRNELRLSVVVPVYRAEHLMGPVLSSISDYLKSMPWRSEVIVVDDGSPDDTAVAAARRSRTVRNLRVLRHKKPRGVGAAARTGVRVAAGKYVVVCDADPTLSMRLLGEIERALEEGADAVFATREADGGLGDTAFRTLARWMVPEEMTNVPSGLRGFRMAVGKQLADRSRIDGATWDLEWVTLARSYGCHVRELPAFVAVGPGPRLQSKSVRELWSIRKNFGNDRYRLPREDRGSLEDTTFVRSEFAAKR